MFVNTLLSLHGQTCGRDKVGSAQDSVVVLRGVWLLGRERYDTMPANGSSRFIGVCPDPNVGTLRSMLP